MRLLRLRSQGFPPPNSCSLQQLDSNLWLHSALPDQQGLQHRVDSEPLQLLKIQFILAEYQQSILTRLPLQADQNSEKLHLEPTFVLQWL